MKRSAAINDINIILGMIFGHQYTKEQLDATSAAEIILNRLEKQGMLPPMIPEKSFYIADNGEEIYATHEWEPE